MPRNIYLICYSSRPFKDHWALLVPSAANPAFGTLIQVEGDVRGGFRHAFRRNYNSQQSNRNLSMVLLGAAADEYVHATPSTGPIISTVTTALDSVEQVAFNVPPPGPSMNSTTGNAPPARRIHFSDCQWWTRQVVERLTHEGILPAASLQVLDATPRN